jgi:DNA-binding XRE family transcriptional regulator
MKVRDFDIIERKLGMESRDSTHHHVWLVHDGMTVVRTKRSHGNSKFLPEHLIRKQLHMDQEQFANLISCHLKKEQYIQILIEKGVIAKPQPNPETAT